MSVGARRRGASCGAARRAASGSRTASRYSWITHVSNAHAKEARCEDTRAAVEELPSANFAKPAWLGRSSRDDTSPKRTLSLPRLSLPLCIDRLSSSKVLPFSGLADELYGTPVSSASTRSSRKATSR
eukprot:TRINITY_DN100761_c0_g1_i1.p1 TRINITY_DN100761_c0_g1~~TRINITY_DN100761_c0_g1_i1.p1  ORF type:complete len:128 (+),score=6.80 TRINITY_DN100761_c0_g1_i1:59-442(+)